MILIYLNLLFSFVKLYTFFVFNVLIHFQALVIKLSIIGIILLGLILLYYLDKKKETQPLEKKIESFRLPTFSGHWKDGFLFNWLIIIAYSLIFFVGILSFRFINQEQAIDLIILFYFTVNLYIKLNWIDISLNILLFLLFFVLIIKVTKRFTNYFMFQVHRRHLYYSSSDIPDIYLTAAQKRYRHILHTGSGVFGYLHTFDALESYIDCKLSVIMGNIISYFGYPRVGYDTLEALTCRPKDCFYDVLVWIRAKIDKLYNLFVKMLRKIHYIILIIVVLYDLIYNHFVVSTMFTILPYIFIYDMWLRYSHFMNKFFIHADEILRSLLYEKSKVYNKDGIRYVDFYGIDKVYTKEHVNRIIKYYMFANFEKDYLIKKCEEENDEDI